MRLLTLFCLPLFFIGTACKTSKHAFRHLYTNTNDALHQADSLRYLPFLKAHLKNGEVYIFQQKWSIDTTEKVLEGIGDRYDYNRQKIGEGRFAISFDSLAIVETNTQVPKNKGRVAALTILTTLNTFIAGACLANPKACFGSCPTFYLNDDSHLFYSDAEGFSNAISPSMEYGDVDALNNNHPLKSQILTLKMKNEALETHAIKDMQLLAYPRQIDEKVFHYHRPDTKIDDYYLTERNMIAPTTAQCLEGDCLPLLQNIDKVERFSWADDKNMSSKEEIFLDFKDLKIEDKDKGLVVTFRQTLMTTYLIYSALGYMGSDVSDIFQRIETQKSTKNSLSNMHQELGTIEVSIFAKGQWWQLDNLYETGPIAYNTQIVKLPDFVKNDKDIRLKIRLNKGLWRLDMTNLVNIKEKVEPIAIRPEVIWYKDQLDTTAKDLLDSPIEHLVSLPSDVYTFQFRLPKDEQDYELFLYSKGYYLEWVRKEWLAEKNLFKLRQMIVNPKKYLKDETKNFIKYEKQMEQQFWNSRISPQTFSFGKN